MHLLFAESADKLLTRIIAEYRTNKTDIRVSEFSPETSYDITGASVSNNDIIFSKKKLEQLSKNDVRQIAFTLCELEDKLGAPIVVPGIDSKDVEFRSSEAIAGRLSRYIRKNVYENKKILNLNPDVKESQNIDILASIEVLKIIQKQDPISLYSSYVKVITISKRDELFYKRRHPKLVALHRSCDPETVAMRREYEWALGAER